MTARSSLIRSITAFAVPYMLGVVAAVLSLWIMLALTKLYEGEANLPLDGFTTDIFLMLAIGIASVAFLPAIIAVNIVERDRREPSLKRYVAWGGTTAVAAIISVLIASVDFDLGNQWARRSILQKTYLLPVFAIAGSIAGAVFGVVRLRLARKFFRA